LGNRKKSGIYSTYNVSYKICIDEHHFSGSAMPQIDIRIEKCPIPIIWLDTSVLLKLALLKLGRLSDAQKPRLQRLREQIYSLTRSGKLLCPEAGQPREVWARRSEFMDVLDELSLGVAVKRGIEDVQVERLMAAYIEGKELVRFRYTDAFASDPIRKAQEALTSKYFVTVDMGLMATVDRIKSQRRGIYTEWEALRQRCFHAGIKYEEQLQRENFGGINEKIKMARDWTIKFIRNEEPTDNEFWSHHYMCNLIEIWNLLSGQPKGFEGLINFLYSPYFASAPSVEISSKIVAKLMVGATPIANGDAMDVDHISSMLPYADLIVVDRRMRHMIRGLKLDSKYKTEVCYIGNSDEDEVDSFLRRAEQSSRSIVTSVFQ
jgi:hypothetical protein